MKEPIAIVFSDLHINMWSKFNDNNERTLNNLRVLSCIMKECKKYKVPALFCGDLFHKPENIDSDLMNIVLEQCESIFNTSIEMYMISGNHDIKHTSKIGAKPFSWVEMMSRLYNRVNNLDYGKIDLYGGGYYVMVHGIPYIDHNIGLNEYISNMELNDNYKHILMLHTDYPGAKDTDGREVDSVENLNINTLNRFDLVLCGHIHKAQRLSKKVYMIGAPLQQRRTDSKCKMGYWVLYSDLSMEFKALDFPKFIDVEDESQIKDDGNYYTILPKKTSISVNTEHKITKQLSKTSLARKYMREKGIKNKYRKKLLVKILKQSETC